MIRYIFVHHPLAVCVVLFIAAMIAIRHWLAPPVVNQWGVVGGIAVWDSRSL
jgi:hypothetical protein